MAFDDQEQNQDDTVTAPWQRKTGYTGQSDEQQATRDQNYGGNPETEQAFREMMAQYRTMPGPNGEYYKRVYPLQPKAEPSTGQESNEGMFREILKKARTGDFSPRSQLRVIRDPNAVESGSGYWPYQHGIFSTFYPGGKEAMLSSRNDSREAGSFDTPEARLEQPGNPTSSFAGVGDTQPSFEPRSSGDALSTQQPHAHSTQQKQRPEAGRQGPSESGQSSGPHQPFRPWQPPKEPVNNPTFFFGNTQSAKSQPDPSWTEIREYIAQEARAYGIPVKLAEAVVGHETNFNIHSDVSVKDKYGNEVSRDYGIMGVNSTNTESLTGPEGFGFKVDMKRVQNDWKYNVHVGMAILHNAYAAAALNTGGVENVARETYARYNARRAWKQLYTVPRGKINHNVDQFMKSWHHYYDEVK